MDRIHDAPCARFAVVLLFVAFFSSCSRLEPDSPPVPDNASTDGETAVVCEDARPDETCPPRLLPTNGHVAPAAVRFDVPPIAPISRLPAGLGAEDEDRPIRLPPLPADDPLEHDKPLDLWRLPIVEPEWVLPDAAEPIPVLPPTFEASRRWHAPADPSLRRLPPVDAGEETVNDEPDADMVASVPEAIIRRLPAVDPPEPAPSSEPAETDSPVTVESDPDAAEHQSPAVDPPEVVETPVRLPAAPDQPEVLSGAMAAVARHADRSVAEAFGLARRGAHFSARAGFIKALRTISQALDTQAGTQEHSRALASGLRAMKEADDFVPAGSRLEGDLNVAALVAAHRTPVLKDEDAETMTSVVALQRYYAYAQTQLAAAAGNEPVGSKALYGMGKVHMALAKLSQDGSAVNSPRAMALHQAALMVDSRNYMAANELGVLLARHGQFVHARHILLHSLSIRPEPETWHNLAVVHQQLGEMDLARRAEQVSRSAGRNGVTTAGGPQDLVRWVSPESFARGTNAGAEVALQGRRTAGRTSGLPAVRPR